MSELQPGYDFRIMALMYKFRDFFKPRSKILEEVGIKPGDRLLDYGCGPGGYVASASKLVGESGRVYALDVHPLAIQSVDRLVSEKKLANVETVRSDCDTGLPDGAVDVVLLYDVFHDLSEPERVMDELHRVLKSAGILSVSDHHLYRDKIVSDITAAGLFELAKKGAKTYSFTKKNRY